VTVQAKIFINKMKMYLTTKQQCKELKN